MVKVIFSIMQIELIMLIRKMIEIIGGFLWSQHFVTVLYAS